MGYLYHRPWRKRGRGSDCASHFGADRGVSVPRIMAKSGGESRPVVLQRQGLWSRQCRTLSGGIQVQFCFTETGLVVQTVQKTGDSMVQFWDGR